MEYRNSFEDDELDAAVFDAYGWPHDLTDEEIHDRSEADLKRAIEPGPEAMFKFSHAELDRRMRELEEHQRDLERGYRS